MNREEAYLLLTKYLKNGNLIKHCIACEAAMKTLCKHFHPDADEATVETWGIAGLLHDVDYEIAKEENKLDQHGVLIFDREPNVIPDTIAHAIKAHNFENTKVDPTNDMDWSIACVDQLTGLIVACALIIPSKKLADIDADFVIKRFNTSGFAKGASRTAIARCEEKLNISLREFVEITLKAMQEISAEMGL